MGVSVKINTPMPTAEQVADRLGLSQERRTLLRELADSVNSPTRIKTTMKRTAAKKSLPRAKAA